MHTRPAAHGLFEAHLPVHDLDLAIRFYTDVVGLVLAHRVPARQCAFLWAGGPGHSMLGLWAGTMGRHRMTMHVAFRTTLTELQAAPAALRAAGIVPLDFEGCETVAPVVLAWMPAAALYFRDPDGHLLEYIVMLDDPPRPDCGVCRWDEWAASAGGRVPGDER
jgi:lactoylglutathione lyase